jgi:hypothetical protein
MPAAAVGASQLDISPVTWTGLGIGMRPACSACAECAPAIATARGNAHFCGSVCSWSSSVLRAEHTAANVRREHGRAGTSGRSPAGLKAVMVRACMLDKLLVKEPAAGNRTQEIPNPNPQATRGSKQVVPHWFYRVPAPALHASLLKDGLFGGTQQQQQRAVAGGCRRCPA